MLKKQDSYKHSRKDIPVKEFTTTDESKPNGAFRGFLSFITSGFTAYCFIFLLLSHLYMLFVASYFNSCDVHIPDPLCMDLTCFIWWAFKTIMRQVALLDIACSKTCLLQVGTLRC